MGKAVDGAYTSLIQGVSQQAPINRIDGQQEAMTNMSCDPEKGLMRRPPTEFVGFVGEAGVYKEIEIDGEQIILAINNGDVRAFTTNGEEVVVNGDQSAKDYLQGSPTFGVLSTQDGSFISNPTKEVKMLPDLTENNNRRAIIHVVGGQYGRKYEVQVKFNEEVVPISYTTVDGSAATHGPYIATDYIATQLEARLREALVEYGKTFQFFVTSAGLTTTSPTTDYSRTIGWTVDPPGDTTLGDTYRSGITFSGVTDNELIVKPGQTSRARITLSGLAVQTSFESIGVTISFLHKGAVLASGSTTFRAGQNISVIQPILNPVVTADYIVPAGDTITLEVKIVKSGTARVPANFQFISSASSPSFVSQANPRAEVAFTVERNSDVILLTYILGRELTDFDVTANDGDGGVNLIAFADRIKDSGRLSRFAPYGYTVCVTGSESSHADDWYLKFDKPSQSQDLIGEGLWIETTKPGVQYKFDLTTMPHMITKAAEGIVIKVGEWADRRAGDDDTNPIPDFVGSCLEDITIFQGRLVVLSGSNVIMSRTSRHLDFWKNSAIALVDDDPISVSSATTRSAPIMKKAIPHNRDLVIFSETAQFIVFGRNAITPRNTSLVLTTTYGANLTAAPVSGGKNIFYAVDLGGFTGVKEFYTEGDADANASRPITSHCTRYITGAAKLIQTSANFDIVLVQTTMSKKDLYVYEYIWIDNQKLQSAWSTWRFTEDVLSVIFSHDTIYFVTEFNGVGRLLRMPLDRAWDTKEFQVHLDNKMYIADIDTSISIPDPLVTLDGLRFIQGPGCPDEGLEAPVFTIEDGEVKLHYSMNGGTIIAGTEYSSEVTLTQPVVRDQRNEPVTTGSLSVHHFTVSAMTSGYITGTTTPQFSQPRTHQYDVRLIASPKTTLGAPAIGDFQVVFPFMSDVTKASFTLGTSRHTPLRLVQVTWKGDYVKTGTHI